MTKLELPVLLALAVLAAGPARAQTKLDTTRFVVVGEGLAAGMADFALREVYQSKSFGAQMARQINTAFPQPLIESPGLGNAPGFTELPVHLPATLQGTVRTPFPPPSPFVFNLSIPGQRLADSLTRRPIPPLVQQRDSQQTVVNLILGYPALLAGGAIPLLTQAEYVFAVMPTFLIVELGYYDVLEPAVKDDPRLLPDVTTFKTNLTQLLSVLKGANAEMLVMTIPDPFDTPYFTPLSGVTRLIGTPQASLMSIFKLNQDDMVTPFGLMLAGNRINSRKVSNLAGLRSLSPGTVVSAATRTAVRSRVAALNTEVVNAAKAAGANVYDLAGLFTRIRLQGLQVGSKRLTADFLGGFYSLDGYYPGAVGQGVIANEVLALLNDTYKTSFPLLDLAAVSADDPAGRFTPASAKKPIATEELQ